MSVSPRHIRQTEDLLILLPSDQKLTPPEFWDRLEFLFGKLELDWDSPWHKYIITLDEIERLSTVLDEMETHSCKLYAEFENEMQEQFEDLAVSMEFRMRIIRDHGDEPNPSDGDDAEMKILLDNGRIAMAHGEANLVQLEDRMGGTWSIISLLDEALAWLRKLGVILTQFLNGNNSGFQVLTNSQILLLEGHHPRPCLSLTQ